MAKRKKLVCQVLPPDEEDPNPHLMEHIGSQVTLDSINRNCSPAPPYCWWGYVTVKEYGEFRKLYVPTDRLMPVDIRMVPATHLRMPRLIQAWVFHEAMCDAWLRIPPDDMKAYVVEWGEEWKDERIFDIGRS